MDQYLLNQFATATYNEIYDTECNNGEWNYNHEETNTSLDDYIKSAEKETKTGKIAGLKFIACNGFSIVDFDDSRIIIYGLDLTDFT